MLCVVFLAIFAVVSSAPATKNENETVEKRQLRDHTSMYGMTTSPVSVRLAQSPYPYQGRLEVYMAGTWGSVCSVGADSRLASVVCRQLGHSNAGVIINDGHLNQYTQPPSHIWVDALRCMGTEQSLEQCSLSYSHNSPSCHHSQDIAVMCHADGQESQHYEPHYDPSHYDPSQHYEPAHYDPSQYDPHYGSVMIHPLPSPHIPMELRLTGGSSMEGKVEVRVHGIWKTICDDHWDNLDASVACRQLGFSSGQVLDNAYYHFGEGIMDVWMDDVACTGYESSLEQCAHKGYGVHDCSGDIEPAAVTCMPSSSYMPQLPSAPETRPAVPQMMPPYISAPQHVPIPARLYASRTGDDGLVEISINGDWKYICADQWDNNDAHVLCRQLGYSYGMAISSDDYPTTNYDFWLDEVTCTGLESSLDTCPSIAHGRDYCHSYKPAAVSCGPTRYYNSYPMSHVPQISHPMPQSPYMPYPSNVRLVGGNGQPGQGLVLLDTHDFSGHICSRSFHDADAQVVCREMRYSTGVVVPNGVSVYGPGTHPVVMTGLACLGSELSVVNCPQDYMNYYCTQNEVAAVHCY